MMRLLAIDLSDTKKLTNKKALISQRKKEMFKKLFELTFTEYQEFWFKLTDGVYKKGNAQLIKSGNIAKAKVIYESIIEKRKENKNINSDNIKTIRDLINNKTLRENESDKLDDVLLGYDSEISSDEDSLDSSLDESSDNDDINSNDIINKLNKEKEQKEKEKKEKEEKEKKEKEEKQRKEKEEKEKKEKEEKEKEEKLKKFMNKEDEIDIFN